jgi:hypothetical protein
MSEQEIIYLCEETQKEKEETGYPLNPPMSRARSTTGRNHVGRQSTPPLDHASAAATSGAIAAAAAAAAAMKRTSLLLVCVVGFIAAVLAACCFGGRSGVSLSLSLDSRDSGTT